MADTHVLCVGDIDIDLFVALPDIPGFDQKSAAAIWARCRAECPPTPPSPSLGWAGVRG